MMKIDKCNAIFMRVIAILGVLLFAKMSFAQSISDIEQIKQFYTRYMEAIKEGEDETAER